MKDALVIIPTYNERENLSRLIESLLGIRESQFDLLVVDDDSPDGTGKLADQLARANSRINVLHRTEKSGLGAAYAAAFQWALKHRYQWVVTMDADFSHNPEDVHRLLKHREKGAIVIGSRYTEGGKIEGWNWQRYFYSYSANFVTKIMVGIPARDATAGFKCYPRSFLERIPLENLIASGYAFQVEMLMRARELGYKLVEIPITFVDRRVGESKISGEVKRSISVILKLAARREGVRQLGKFAIVGLVNTVIDWLIYFLLIQTPLVDFGQLGKQLAKAGSFVVSGVSSYYMNRTWTFRSKDKAVIKQASMFFVVATIGLGLNNLIFYLASAPNYLGLPDIVALIVATGTVGIWNFIANKYWTFKDKSKVNKGNNPAMYQV